MDLIFWRKLAVFVLINIICFVSADCCPSSGQDFHPQLAEQSGHSSLVDALVITKDSRWLISAGHDFSIRLWDLQSGHEVRVLGRHNREVLVLAPCPHDDCVISGGTDHILKLWALPSGKLLQTFTGHVGVITGAVFMADGKQVISVGGDPPYLKGGMSDSAIRVWDVKSGRELYRLTGHNGSISSIDLDQHRNLLATGSFDGTIRIWDLVRREQHIVIKGFTTGTIVRFSPDGHRLISASDRNIRVWDVSTGMLLKELATDSVLSIIAFAPDGKWLAYASNTTIKFLDLNTGLTLGYLRSESKVIRALAMSPNGHSAFVGYQNGLITQWDISTQKQLRELGGHISAIDAVAVSPNGRWIASAHRDSTIRLWDRESGQLEYILPSESAHIRALEFSFDNRSVAASGEEDPWQAARQSSVGRPVEIWELATGKRVARFIHEGTQVVEFLKFSPDGRWLASGAPLKTGISATVKLWNLTNRNLTVTLAPANKVVAFSPDGESVATGNTDGALTYWESRTGRMLTRFPDIGWAYAISSDQQWLATMGWGNEFKVFEFATVNGTARQHVYLGVFVWGTPHPRYRTFKGHQALITDVIFSPDNRIVASASLDGQIKLWNLNSGREMYTLSGSNSNVESLAFSADGRWLISGSWDGKVRVWDVITGHEFISLIGMRDSTDWLAVAPDGLFDGTAKAMQQIAWRGENDAIFPLDSFYTDFYYPGLLTEVLGRKNPTAQLDIAVMLQIPSLRLMLSDQTAHVEIRGRNTVLCFKEPPGVAMQVPAISDLDMPIEHGDFRIQPKDATCKYQKIVSAGSAKSLKKLETLRSIAFTTPWDGHISDTRRSTLHVLSIGVGQYSKLSGFDPLPYALSSAKAIEELFTRRHANSSYANVRVWPGLYDQDATTTRIRETLNEIAKEVSEQDVILLYLAGHGSLSSGREMFYFGSYDAREPEIRETAISTALLAEVLRKMQARRIVLIIDACESGGTVEALSKIGEIKTKAQLHKVENITNTVLSDDRGIGVHIITATLPLAYAVQLKPDRSALAATLIQLLEDSSIRPTVRNLIESLQTVLPEISQKAVGFRQVPLSRSIGLDFPLL
jgi:WD40 repeat protein